MTTFLRRCVDDLIHRVGDKTLTEYWDLSHEKKYNISVSVSNEIAEQEKALVSFNFSAPNPLFKDYFQKLPLDINREIWGYIDWYATLVVQIIYSDNYPFQAPIWEFVDIQTSNVKTKLDLKKYYKDIIRRHNSQYEFANNWSPAIKIDFDILIFLNRINHFDCILKYRDIELQDTDDRDESEYPRYIPPLHWRCTCRN